MGQAHSRCNHVQAQSQYTCKSICFALANNKQCPKGTRPYIRKKPNDSTGSHVARLSSSWLWHTGQTTGIQGTNQALPNAGCQLCWFHLKVTTTYCTHEQRQVSSTPNASQHYSILLLTSTLVRYSYALSLKCPITIQPHLLQHTWSSGLNILLDQAPVASARHSVGLRSHRWA
jgi:hypothetical protein